MDALRIRQLMNATLVEELSDISARYYLKQSEGGLTLDIELIRPPQPQGTNLQN